MASLILDKLTCAASPVVDYPGGSDQVLAG